MTRLPYSGGRPGGPLPLGSGRGTLSKAASLRNRLTTTPAASSAFRNGRLALAPSTTIPMGSARDRSQSTAPEDQFRGQFQLGPEGEVLAVLGRDLAEVLFPDVQRCNRPDTYVLTSASARGDHFPDVQQSTQRQAVHSPARVLHELGTGDCDLAVRELLLGGPGE